MSRDRAYAVPHYQKLHTRVPHDWGIAGFNHPQCNGIASTWATCLDDHRGPVPGKLRLGGWLARYISQPNIKLVVDKVITDCTN